MSWIRVLSRGDRVVIGGSVAAIALAGFTRSANAVLAFACAALAVGLLAALVGRCVDQLGDRFGAGATGVLQSALGNLPELFISFFALQQGLVAVVQSAIIGSILANLLLVLGAAFLIGGLRNGPQRFDSARARDICVLLALATSALVLPSLAMYTHAPAAKHVRTLSDAVALVLLAVFALSLPAALRRGSPDTSSDQARPAAAPAAAGGDRAPDTVTDRAPDTLTDRAAAAADDPAPGSRPGDAATVERPSQSHGGVRWPLALAIGLLAASGVAAAVVSEWFVAALEPAIDALGISQAFAGLVVVAIAGNAVENVVGIQLAARNQADYAVSVIVNSPLQIALVLAPALVLLSLLTTTTLTLVFAPMLVVAVVLAVLVVTLIVVDGESNWLEGVALIGLYVMIAAVFWWG
ncbi:MAG TPA: sodium:proton exchanger [Micromonosporaceae bacterium]